MHSKLGCYQLKVDYCKHNLFYVSVTVTAKQMPIVEIKRQESKRTTEESHQSAKEEAKKSYK